MSNGALNLRRTTPPHTCASALVGLKILVSAVQSRPCPPFFYVVRLACGPRSGRLARVTGRVFLACPVFRSGTTVVSGDRPR